MSIKLTDSLYLSADGTTCYILEAITEKKDGSGFTVKRTYYPNLRLSIEAALERQIMRSNQMKRIPWNKIERDPAKMKIVERRCPDLIKLHRLIKKCFKEVSEGLPSLPASTLRDELRKEIESRPKRGRAATK